MAHSLAGTPKFRASHSSAKLPLSRRQVAAPFDPLAGSKWP